MSPPVLPTANHTMSSPYSHLSVVSLPTRSEGQSLSTASEGLQDPRSPPPGTLASGCFSNMPSAFFSWVSDRHSCLSLESRSRGYSCLPAACKYPPKCHLSEGPPGPVLNTTLSHFPPLYPSSFFIMAPDRTFYKYWLVYSLSVSLPRL